MGQLSTLLRTLGFFKVWPSQTLWYEVVRTLNKLILKVDLPKYLNLENVNKQKANYVFNPKFLKDIENLAIILVSLIIILSRGHTGQTKG